MTAEGFAVAIFASIALLLALVGCATLVVRSKRGEEYRKFARDCIVVLVACVLVEGLLFNLEHFQTRDLQPVDAEYTVQGGGDAPFTEIALGDLQTQTIRVHFTGAKGVFTVKASIKDDASSQVYSSADQREVMASDEGEAGEVLRVISKGAAHSIRVEWDKADVTLASVELNVPVPYRFSPLRLCLLAVPILLVVFVRKMNLWGIAFDQRSRKQRTAYAVCMVICLLLPLCVNTLVHPARAKYAAARGIAYPLKVSPESISYQAHALMFDALFHGGEIQAEPSDELLELENPYDDTLRESKDIDFLYDYALYDGTYYSYFGLTPVFVVYAPFYILFGRLPSYVTAAFALSLLAVIGAFLCVWELAIRFARKTRLMAVVLSAVGVVLGSNLLTAQSCADRYYLTDISMIAFVFLTLWCGLLATRVDAKKRLARTMAFALCGVLTILTIWSRTSGALTAIGWLLPLFVLLLLDKGATRGQKTADALSYLVPTLLGAGVILWYNSIRFSGPLDFGQTYQLTVADMRTFSLKVEHIPQALWHYFLDGVTVSSDFPWIQVTRSSVNHTGNYLYSANNAGALVIPFTWGIFLWRRRKDADWEERGNMIVMACALLFSLLVCWMDFDLGGIHQRYVYDVLPSLLMLSSVQLMKLCGDDELTARILGRRILRIVLVGTAIVALCFVFANERNNIMKHNAEAYLYAVNLLSMR